MSNTNLNDVSVDDDKGGHFYPADGQQPQPEEGQQNDQPGSGTTLFEDVSGMQMRTLGMIAIGVGVGVVLLLACVGVCCYLRRGTRALPGSPPTFRAPGNEEVRAPYTAAIRNRDFMHPEAEPKCQNCNLIEMGSMACYEGVCPQCGRPPPK